MISYIKECDLGDFPAWKEAIHTLDVICSNGDEESVEEMIEETFGREGNIPTEYDINGFLSYAQDKIAQRLGCESWEEYEGL